MLVLDKIVKQLGGVKCIEAAGSVRVERSGWILLLEYLGSGPTAEHAMRVARCNRFGLVDQEIHMELRGNMWMPYFFGSPTTKREVFLYRFAGVRVPLRLDFEAGLRLIEATAILDFNLLADGFAEAAEDNLYHPLFSLAGGAA